MAIDTNRAAALAEETVAITHAGVYVAPSGRSVSIADAVARAVAGTRELAPDAALDAPGASVHATRVRVSDESTLSAARRLTLAGQRVAALDFASARHPGGGFLTGALAQEESLCRASALYACLERQPMYAFHRMRNDAMYSDRVIYAPDVPVFRDDDGALLEEPYLVSFLAAPAVNARVVLERDPAAGPVIARAMAQRAARVLAVAAANGQQTLVLGAWGCGVFGNDATVVAEAFGAALDGPFRGVFAEVVFAIYPGPGGSGATRDAFVARFG